jgi:hypothetical protein
MLFICFLATVLLRFAVWFQLDGPTFAIARDVSMPCKQSLVLVE